MQCCLGWMGVFDPPRRRCCCPLATCSHWLRFPRALNCYEARSPDKPSARDAGHLQTLRGVPCWVWRPKRYVKRLRDDGKTEYTFDCESMFVTVGRAGGSNSGSGDGKKPSGLDSKATAPDPKLHIIYSHARHEDILNPILHRRLQELSWNLRAVVYLYEYPGKFTLLSLPPLPCSRAASTLQHGETTRRPDTQLNDRLLHPPRHKMPAALLLQHDPRRCQHVS